MGLYKKNIPTDYNPNITDVWRNAVPKDSIWAMTKKVAPMSLLLPLLSAGVSYAAYADDLSVSGWPWKIGLLVTFACFVAPLVIYMMYRRTNLLWVCGLVQSIGVFAVYFFRHICLLLLFHVCATATESPMARDSGWYCIDGVLGSPFKAKCIAYDHVDLVRRTGLRREHV